jgi:hypothetical protein
MLFSRERSIMETPADEQRSVSALAREKDRDADEESRSILEKGTGRGWRA